MCKRFVIGVSFLGLLFESFCGCRMLDGTPEHRTRNKLEILGKVVEAHVRSGSDLRQFGDLHSFLASSVKKRFISDDDYDQQRYVTDGWDHQFTWEVRTEKDGLRIRILSAGPDGVLQEGEGDDQYVEVEVKDGKHVTTHLK